MKTKKMIQKIKFKKNKIQIKIMTKFIFQQKKKLNPNEIYFNIIKLIFLIILIKEIKMILFDKYYYKWEIIFNEFFNLFGLTI